MLGFPLQFALLIWFIGTILFFVFLLSSVLKRYSDSESVRQSDDDEFQKSRATKRKLPVVQMVSDHLTAVSVFNLANKCRRITFCTDDNEFKKVRQTFLDQICCDKRRAFYLCNTDDTIGAFVCLGEFQKNIWQVTSFGIDPAGFDARTPFEWRDFRPIRIIIDSISVDHFPSSHIFMEIFRADYESLAILKFCGFEEMLNPPFENDIDKLVLVLNTDLKREDKNII